MHQLNMDTAVYMTTAVLAYESSRIALEYRQFRYTQAALLLAIALLVFSEAALFVSIV